jgi:hypothetical protein
MKKIFFSFIFLYFYCFVSILNAQIDIESQDTIVNLIVEGCNNNLICEPILGEDNDSCPLDCPFITPIPTTTPPLDSIFESSGSSRSNTRNIFPEITSTHFLEISNLKAIIENKTVNFFWKNPEINNFDFIRIVKNNYFTSNPYEGVVVYEGKDQSFVDTVEFFDQRYFYNFFVRYTDGTFSKGINMVIVARKPSIFEEIKTKIKDDLKVEEEPFEPVFVAPRFNIYDLRFTQNEQSLIWNRRVLISKSLDPIFVTLPKKDFFGPIFDVFFEFDIYNSDGEFLRREVLKMDYLPQIQSYQTKIEDFSNKDRIYFKIYFTDDKNQENFVSGIINIDRDFVEKVPEKKYNLIFILIIIILIIALFLRGKLRF